MLGRSATIKDVARKAGFSTATVSRVLNGDTHVSDETRNAVGEAVRELEYSRNEVARSLKTRKTKTIGVIAPELTNDFFMGIACGIESELKKSRHSVIICNSNESAEEETRMLKVLAERSVDGVIVIPATDRGDHFAPFAESGMRIVLADRLVEGFTADAVLSDNFGGARAAVSSFVAAGKRRIGFIGGTARLSNARERYEGYLAALRAGGIEPDNAIVRFGDFHLESGYTLMRELAELPEPPDAVFIANLYMHIGATNYLLSRTDGGRFGPGGAAYEIAGFDEMAYSPLLRFCTVAVRQDITGLGMAAARLLLDRIAGRSKSFPAIVRIPTRLVFHGK